MNGHQARKRFGQNFLVSPGIIRKIIDAVAPRAGDTVVEIGPGLGALTEPLLERIDHLHVVEIDRDLIERLRQRFPPERLTIHAGDALEFDFGALQGAGPLKIVGNLPYNISTPLLFHLSDFAGQVSEMHFMLQKEVVDRMVSAPGGDFGRLSVMLQYRYNMERLFVVPPGSFNPAPKVDSAFVRMIPKETRRAAPSVALPLEGGAPRSGDYGVGSIVGAGGTAECAALDEILFAKLVATAFSQRRKMLRNTLKEFGGEVFLEAQGIAPTARPETLSVSDYVRLANALTARIKTK